MIFVFDDDTYCVEYIFGNETKYTLNLNYTKKLKRTQLIHLMKATSQREQSNINFFCTPCIVSPSLAFFRHLAQFSDVASFKSKQMPLAQPLLMSSSPSTDAPSPERRVPAATAVVLCLCVTNKNVTPNALKEEGEGNGIKAAVTTQGAGRPRRDSKPNKYLAGP